MFQVCNEAAGGLVSTRDFVNLRHWSQVQEGVYISAICSVDHVSMPEVQGWVRGYNGPGCFVLEPGMWY